MYCLYDETAIVKMFNEYQGYELTTIDNDFIVDFFGMRISIRYAKYLAQRAGTNIERPPFPDDSIRASFIEYLAVVESIRDCGSIYQMAEIGASYAPFSALCAKLALRKGVSKAILRPVEAAFRGVESIQGNFSDNNLLNEQVDLRVIQAAVVGSYKDVYFPDVECTVDNGAAAQDQSTDLDIRGATLPMIKIKGIPLSFVIDSFPYNTPIDLLHIDIQGSELYAVPIDITYLNDMVKRVMLATHSRPIDGIMMETFHRAGWKLIAEEPCEFTYRRDLNEIEGMTIKDGAQYWVNESIS